MDATTAAPRPAEAGGGSADDAETRRAAGRPNRPPWWSRAGIPWFGGLFIGGIAALAIFDIVRGHQAAVAETGRDLDTQARVLAEQAARSLQAVELVLRRVGEQSRGGAGAGPGARDLHTYLKDQAVGLVQIEGLSLVDADGTVRASSASADLPEPPPTMAGHPMFPLARSDATHGLMVGSAWPSVIQPGPWVFPIARRLRSPASGVAGAVVADGKVEYFQHFYRDVQLGEGSSVLLMHRNGTLLAAHPAGAALGQRNVAFAALPDSGAATDREPVRSTSTVDGVERFASTVQVAGYPLAVVVTREARVALAPWRAQAIGTVLRTLALGVMAGLLLAMLRRQFQRLDRTRRSLEVSRERFALAAAGADDGIWDWDVAGDVVYASERARELFGVGPGPETVPRAAWFAAQHVHPDDAAARSEAIAAHWEGRSPVYAAEFRVLQADGAYRWVRVRGVCVRGADGVPLRMAGSVTDIDARKTAEDSLRRSEERYALAVAGSDDGVWDWDFRAGVAFESARARELQGLPPGPEVQPLQQLVDSLQVHPDDVPLRAEGIRAHLAGETDAYECEYRVRHADGGYRWVRVRALCTRDANGEPLRMAGSVSDIDARKRAEEALRQSEQRFALAVAGSNDGILDWDIVSDSLYVSERAKLIVGVDVATPALTRAEWAALLMPRVHPDDARRITAQLGAQRGDHPPAHEGEYRMRHADGAFRWLRLRGMSVLDAAGRPVRWAGSLSDIDAQKRTEQALRTSEERYQLAVDGANEGLWDWDLVNDSLFLSRRAQELLWLTPGPPQRPRREWIELTPHHPDDRAVVRRAVADHLRGVEPYYKVEYRLRHHTGQWRWYRQRGVAVRDATGRPTRMAGSMEDITDRKQAEAERERLEAQLRQAQKLEAIGTLAGGIAHDFNNILAAILGYGEMALKGAAEGSAQRRHIDAALSAGMRAKSLVERILAFSRSGMGERVPVHVQSVVEEALDLVAASLPPGVVLQRALDGGDAAVMGDPTQVHQVVMNLCTNAAQAMKSKGTLTVTLDRIDDGAPSCATSVLPAGRYIRLTVRDTGIGIPPQLLDRVFDPFFTTKEVGVGTGLGLSLVHGIVTDLGGGIHIDSRPGEGATFTIYLPSQAHVAAPATVEEHVPAGGGQTVLLVDDEEPLVRLGEEMIADLGYEPVGFTSAPAALAALRDDPGRFDAVLSDESMPELSGSELARAIRVLRPDIPIVLMTGHVTPALSQRAREIGVRDVLAKPLAAHDMARCLAAALDCAQVVAASVDEAGLSSRSR